LDGVAVVLTDTDGVADRDAPGFGVFELHAARSTVAVKANRAARRIGTSIWTGSGSRNDRRFRL
jgi:hypothetical protein